MYSIYDKIKSGLRRMHTEENNVLCAVVMVDLVNSKKNVVLKEHHSKIAKDQFFYRLAGLTMGENVTIVMIMKNNDLIKWDMDHDLERYEWIYRKGNRIPHECRG